MAWMEDLCPLRTLDEWKWLVLADISDELWGRGAGFAALGPAILLSLKDTTRPRKSHEKEGVEYHFVSKQAFEADLHHNKYVAS